VNKILIKTIKRKDVEAMRNAKTQSAGEPKQNSSGSKEEIERRSRREIGKAVSNWIPKRRENNRVEEIAAVRRFFDSETLLSES
jgi:hypothetical protein